MAIKRIALAAAFAALAFPALAQVTNGKVTTAAPSYSNGAIAPFSLNTAGALRVVNSGSPSGTQDVNLTQVLGAAPSATNPIWVSPASASNPWPISAASLPLPTGAATQTTLASILSALGSPFQAGGAFALSPVNQTQINGVAILAGNGATGTGSPRVTIASDSSARAVGGEGATAAAAPSGAVQAGVRSGANMVGLIQADASAAISVNTVTTTQLVALSGTTKIYVTSFDVIAGGTGNFTFVYGTGASCGTGTTSLTGAYNLTAQNGIAKGNGLGPVLVVPAGNALCVTTSAAVQMSGSIAYTQF